MVLRRAVLGLAVACIGRVGAASGRIVRITVSDSADGAARAAFGPDTQAIVVAAWREDLPGAAPLACRWIAEDIGMAPPDYQIARQSQPVPGPGTPVHFRLARPRAGWPVGNYRVELAEAGQPDVTARFKVLR